MQVPIYQTEYVPVKYSPDSSCAYLGDLHGTYIGLLSEDIHAHPRDILYWCL